MCVFIPFSQIFQILSDVKMGNTPTHKHISFYSLSLFSLSLFFFFFATQLLRHTSTQKRQTNLKMFCILKTLQAVNRTFMLFKIFNFIETFPFKTNVGNVLIAPTSSYVHIKMSLHFWNTYKTFTDFKWTQSFHTIHIFKNSHFKMNYFSYWIKFAMFGTDQLPHELETSNHLHHLQLP